MKTLFAVSLFFVFFIAANAQDYPLSQPYSNPFWMCPALTGNAETPRLSSFTRVQWPNIGSKYTTSNLGFDKYVKPLHGGLGIYGVYDVAGEGVLKQWSLNAVYSYNYAISEDFKLRVASQYSLVHKNIDISKLISPDQIDPVHGFVNDTNQTYPENGINKSYFDFGISAAADWEKFTFGITGFHLTRPNEGFLTESRIIRRYAAFAGYDLWLMKGEKPEGFRVSPLVYFTTLPGGFSVLAGTNVSWNWLYCGAYYRFNESNTDALAFQAGARFWHFQAGYSYDMTVSKLTNASGGSHEVFLNYFFNKKDKK